MYTVREDPKLYTDYVKDKAAAIAFGKALFWDMQYGSDAVQACASCHYHGGIDPRTKDQLNPGINANDSQFGNPSDVIEKVKNVDGNPWFAPNYEVTAKDFPFHSRDPETAGVPRSADNSADEFGNVVRDVNDVMSSQGVRSAKFLGVLPKVALDLGLPLKDPVFTLKKVNIRRVEPRNTPTMINAVFNADNFWDGRASNVFNGVNPFGFRDQTSTLLKNINGTLSPVQVRLFFSSLASQAVGPPVSDFEMAYQGRDFPRIGRKMLSLKPLAKQLVHPQDSVLGSMSNAKLKGSTVTGNPGLNVATYADMVKKAFKDEWWNSKDIASVDPTSLLTKLPDKQDPRTFIINLGKAIIQKWRSNFIWGPNDFSQMEYNFSLFAGLAVQLYEATLIADDTPYDRAVGANLNVRGGRQPDRRADLSALPDPDGSAAIAKTGTATVWAGLGPNQRRRCGLPRVSYSGGIHRALDPWSSGR